MKKKIILSIIVHNGRQRLAIQFDYDTTIIAAIKQISGAQWSKTKKCWHFPTDDLTYQILVSHPIFNDCLIEQVLHRPREVYKIERPRKPRRLPKVISKKKVAKIIKHANNLKHKCILMLLYSGSQGKERSLYHFCKECARRIKRIFALV